MKLLKLFISVTGFFVFSVSFSQSNISGIIHYESRISSKSLAEYISTKRKEVKNKTLIKSLDKVFLYQGSIKSTLKFSGERGLFVVKDKLSTDIHDLGQRMNKVSAGGSKEYYYDDKTKSYLIKDCEAIGECFIYPNEYLEWKLTQETKKINGYLSYKATRSEGKVIAWYTPSIPVNFGPKGEYGLPGLILELELGRTIFKATEIILNPKDKVVIREPKEGNRVSSEEYKALINKAKKSIFGS